MQRHLAFILGLGLAGILVMPPITVAQTKPLAATQAEQTRTRPPINAATRAMRREAEAKRLEHERIFVKIRRLEPSGVQPVAGLDLQRQRAREEAVIAHLRAQNMQLRLRLAMLNDGLVIQGEAFAPEPEKPPGDEDEAEEAKNENRPAVPPQQKFVVAIENFDQWLFSGDTIEERRARLNDNLRRAIERVDPARRLTAVQRQKLALAGRGDIKHFFDQVEFKRREFEEVQNDLQKCRALVRTLRPLRVAYVTGPFDEGSLFTKVLKTMRPQSR